MAELWGCVDRENPGSSPIQGPQKCCLLAPLYGFSVGKPIMKTLMTTQKSKILMGPTWVSLHEYLTAPPVG